MAKKQTKKKATTPASKSTSPKKGKQKPAAKTNAAGKNSKRLKLPRKNKNVSQNIPNGRVLQTRDEFFEKQGSYKKPDYENKGNYRGAVVVDSNRKNELAVVKLTTSKKGTVLKEYKKGKSKYRPFIETKDDEGNAIKIGRKFISKKPQDDLSLHDVNRIKKDAIKKMPKYSE